MGAPAGLHSSVVQGTAAADPGCPGAPLGPQPVWERWTCASTRPGVGQRPETSRVRRAPAAERGTLPSCPRRRSCLAAHQDHRVGHHGAAASVDEGGPHQGTRRRGSPGGSHEPGGHRDLPALGGLEEQALGDPLVLLPAHEGADPVGTVDEAGADTHELQILSLEGVGPAPFGRLRGQRVEADLHPLVAIPARLGLFR